MAKSSAVIVPISDELEIIECPSTPREEERSKKLAKETTLDMEDSSTENDGTEGRRSRSRTRSPDRERFMAPYSGRYYSPSPRRNNFTSRVQEIPSLASTKSLNAFIKVDDVCVNTVNNQVVYMANYPFAGPDLDKISWIFRIAVEDTWVQRPKTMATKDGYQFDFSANKERRGRGWSAYDNSYPRYYDDTYDRAGRPPTTIARLGNALRVFKSDEKKYGTEKVKFVIVVEGKNNAGWYKMLVAHSRQAALAEVFHEILRGHSIQFLGALSVDAIIPVDVANRKVRFQKIAGLKQMQDCAEGVVGVVC